MRRGNSSKAVGQFITAIRAHNGRPALALAVLSAAVLAACGGGGGSAGDGSATGTDTGGSTPSVGVFTDSPVAGLHYVTSSGLEGTTDAQGHYNYKPGDTVTFSLAGVALGTTAAAGTVTPASIVPGGTEANAFTNLLVTLQSLDADGDASNGITLNAAAVTKTQMEAIVAKLPDAPTAFADPAQNTNLAAVVTALAPTRTIVEPEAAVAHFQATQAALPATVSPFMNDASGVWMHTDAAGNTSVLRITPSGKYVVGNSDPTDGGVEVGTLTRDDTTGKLTASAIVVDTNGTAGLSNPLPTDLMLATFHGVSGSPAGDDTIELKVSATETYTLQRVGNNLSTLQGAWALDAALPVSGEGSQTLVFSADGKFMMFDPVGDVVAAPQVSCGGAGIEAGTYAWDAATGALTVNVLKDTNGCAGLHDTSNASPTVTFSSAALSADGYTLTLTNAEGTVTLHRIKKRPLSCALKSGDYRLVTLGEAGSESVSLAVDAMTATATFSDGSTSAVKADGADCAFTLNNPAGQKVEMLLANKSGLAVLRNTVAGRMAVVLPKQTLTVADLAGHWSHMGYWNDGTGTFGADWGSFALAADGTTSNHQACKALGTCAPVTETHTMAAGQDGGFLLNGTDGVDTWSDSFYAYRAPSGQMVGVLTNVDGFEILSLNTPVLTAPAAGTFSPYWYYTLNATDVAGARNADAVTVLASSATEMTRRVKSSGNAERFTLNDPGTGLRRRATNDCTKADGTAVACNGVVQLSLPSVGITVGAPELATNHFLSLSVMRP